MERRLVLVTGSPGAGKSTVAGPLAESLGFALLAKDHVKETLHDALGASDGDLASSRRLGAAAMALLWALARHCPRVVLEANFWPDHPDTRAELAALDATVVEVYCRCPPAEAVRRYARRAPTNHPVHAAHELSVDTAAAYRPLNVGPLVILDTTVPTDVPALARRVRAAFDRPDQAGGQM